MKLAEIAKAVAEELDEKEAAREAMLKSSRALVRKCGAAIMSMHKGEDPSASLAVVKRDVGKLNALLANYPEMASAGAAEAAHQEYAEAVVLRAVSTGAELPGHRELGVTPQAYLEGIGDAVGELRRMALSALMAGDTERARALLEEMDLIYDFLMRFHYPAALAGVRRKQDVARSLIEKTRGELAVAIHAGRLESRLAGAAGRGKKKL
jgi:translin